MIEIENHDYSHKQSFHIIRLYCYS